MTPHSMARDLMEENALILGEPVCWKSNRPAVSWNRERHCLSHARRSRRAAFGVNSSIHTYNFYIPFFPLSTFSSLLSSASPLLRHPSRPSLDRHVLQILRHVGSMVMWSVWCMRVRVIRFRLHEPTLLLDSCLLPDLPGGLLQAKVALLVGASCAKAQPHDGRPRPPLEQQD